MINIRMKLVDLDPVLDLINVLFPDLAVNETVCFAIAVNHVN